MVIKGSRPEEGASVDEAVPTKANFAVNDFDVELLAAVECPDAAEQSAVATSDRQSPAARRSVDVTRKGGAFTVEASCAFLMTRSQSTPEGMAAVVATAVFSGVGLWTVCCTLSAAS